MTALFVSIFVWGIVIMMVTDDYCRKEEKRALNFFLVLGLGLTFIGIVNFETAQLFKVSLLSWVSLGLFPILLYNLKLRNKLVKIQAETLGKKVSLVELNVSEINDTKLVKRYRKLNIAMWVCVLAYLVAHLWSKGAFAT